VELSIQGYIKVGILEFNVRKLENFKILGTVYSLDFTLSERWTKEMIPRKYQYLNGEEISVITADSESKKKLRNFRKFH
jgi:hypothetical protein